LNHVGKINIFLNFKLGIVITKVGKYNELLYKHDSKTKYLRLK
jgi:hypothetical protein